jgi:hypothetical protein
MNKVSWSDVEAGLREHRPSGAIRDAGTFGADFKARARLVRQEAPEEAGTPWTPLLRWGTASFAAVMVLAVAVLFWPVHESLMTQVKSLNILAPHSGVIIMNDEGGQGTVVWITDMEINGGGKG